MTPRVLLAAACVVGLVLRVLWPELRPIHHDEAVNWFLVGATMERGYYAYDASNYHGPLFFHLAALGRWLGPDALVSLRLPTMLVGAAMVPMVAGLRPWFGRWGVVAAAWAIATSPSLVFFARDAIHETLLCAATLGLLVSLVHWQRDGGRLAPLAAGFSLAAMITTKETVVITLGGMVVGAAVAALMGARPRQDPRGLGIALVSCVLPTCALYAGFGAYPEGLTGLMQTLAIWTDRGLEGAGHALGWTTWAHILLRLEAPLLFAGLLGSVVFLRRRDPVGAGLIAWWLSVGLVYSVIPYKTPWCVLQIVLPTTLIVGRLVDRAPGVVVGALLTLGALAQLGRTVDVAFIRYDDPTVPIVYVQTRREISQVVRLLRDVRGQAGEQTRIRAFYPTGYPLNWYLRDRGFVTESYEPFPASVDGDLILALPEHQLELEQSITEDYWMQVLPFRGNLYMSVWLPQRWQHLREHPEDWSWVSRPQPPSDP